MTDAELIEFARVFREGILGDQPSLAMCAAVCWPLEALLCLSGVKVRAQELHFAERDRRHEHCSNHVLLRLEDGRVLDPTADQFGLEPVYLGPLPELYRSWGAWSPDEP